MKTKPKPEPVLRVYRALLENAKEAGLPKGVVSCYQDTVGNSPGSPASMEWRVGSNFEDGSATMIYTPEGKWFYRDPHTGEDSPVKGGDSEALGNCRCFFTG